MWEVMLTEALKCMKRHDIGEKTYQNYQWHDTQHIGQFFFFHKLSHGETKISRLIF